MSLCVKKQKPLETNVEHKIVETTVMYLVQCGKCGLPWKFKVNQKDVFSLGLRGVAKKVQRKRCVFCGNRGISDVSD